jgi:hypothetical protein
LEDFALPDPGAAPQGRPRVTTKNSAPGTKKRTELFLRLIEESPFPWQAGFIRGKSVFDR